MRVSCFYALRYMPHARLLKPVARQFDRFDNPHIARAAADVATEFAPDLGLIGSLAARQALPRVKMSRTVISMPGVQYPHCRPCAS